MFRSQHGYIYTVFHKPLLQVVDDRRLGDLLYKHHVLDADLLLPLMTLNTDQTHQSRAAEYRILQRRVQNYQQGTMGVCGGTPREEMHRQSPR